MIRPFAARVERTGAPLALHVRTASSLWARFRGLMGRRSLAPGEGLWFPGDSSIHMLFMRFPIDAVFLAPASDPAAAAPSPADLMRQAPAGAAPSPADRWRVVAVRPRLRPWAGVVWYVRGARGCLELEAGAAQQADLRVGDTVRFEP